MPTKNLVPRQDDEGKIGVKGVDLTLRWKEINAVSGSLDTVKLDELQNQDGNDLLVGGSGVNINRADSGSGFQYTISASSTGFADKIEEGQAKVETIDTGTDARIEFWADPNDDNTSSKIWEFSENGHLIPAVNSTYDIGSAEYKVRHLFLSDNSLHIGTSSTSDPNNWNSGGQDIHKLGKNPQDKLVWHSNGTANIVAMTGDLHAVATSGSYLDLNNRPLVPDSTNDITADMAGANYGGAANASLTSHLTGINTTFGTINTTLANKVEQSDIDAALQGLDVKPSVRVATTQALSGFQYINGTTQQWQETTASGAFAIQGLQMDNDERILVKDASNKSENGIYIVSGIDENDPSSRVILDRAPDLDNTSDFGGAFTFVEEGTNKGNSYVAKNQDSPGSHQVGTHRQTWTQFNSAGSVTALNDLSDVTFTSGELSFTGLDILNLPDGGSISDGLFDLKNAGSESEIRLYCADNNSHYTALKSAAHGTYTGDITFTLPSSTGEDGQVLSTDGSGVLSWIDPNAYEVLTTVDMNWTNTGVTPGTGVAVTNNNGSAYPLGRSYATTSNEFLLDGITIGDGSGVGTKIMTKGKLQIQWNSNTVNTGDPVYCNTRSVGEQAFTTDYNEAISERGLVHRLGFIDTVDTTNGHTVIVDIDNEIYPVTNLVNEVRVATTGQFTVSGGSYAHGEAPSLVRIIHDVGSTTLTIDGVDLAVGDRILIKDGGSQTSSTTTNADWNGFWYLYSKIGTQFLFHRVLDNDINQARQTLRVGNFAFIREGTTNAGKGFVCTNSTISGSGGSIAFSEFTGSGGIANVEADPAPRLGGNLDTNGLEIRNTNTSAPLHLKTSVASGNSGADIEFTSDNGYIRSNSAALFMDYAVFYDPSNTSKYKSFNYNNWAGSQEYSSLVGTYKETYYHSPIINTANPLYSQVFIGNKNQSSGTGDVTFGNFNFNVNALTTNVIDERPIDSSFSFEYIAKTTDTDDGVGSVETYRTVEFKNNKIVLNGALTIQPGLLELKNDASLNGDSALRIYDDGNTNYVGLLPPATFASGNYNLRLPTDDGSPNQVLKTDGSGNLSWVDQSSGGIANVEADTAPNLGGRLITQGQWIHMNTSGTSLSDTYSFKRYSGMLMIDTNKAGDPHVNIYNSSPSAGATTFSLCRGVGANGQVLGSIRSQTGAATNDSLNVIYNTIETTMVDVTSGSHDGSTSFKVAANGSLTEGLRISADGSNAKVRISDEFWLPTSDGNPNQVLKTDGSGNLGWVDQSGGGVDSRADLIEHVSYTSAQNPVASPSTTAILEVFVLVESANAIDIHLPDPSSNDKITRGFKYNIKSVGDGQVTLNTGVAPTGFTRAYIDASGDFTLPINKRDSYTIIAYGSSDTSLNWYII